MPIFPKIQSPCPYKNDLESMIDGDMCRMCNRTVFDLTAMSDGERVAFLAGCEEEICVSYRIPMRAVLAAAVLAAASPALAQEVPAPEIDGSIETGVPASFGGDETITIMAGGIKDPRKARMVEIGSDPSIAELPVVYEDEDEAAPASPTSAAGPART